MLVSIALTAATVCTARACTKRLDGTEWPETRDETYWAEGQMLQWLKWVAAGCKLSIEGHPKQQRHRLVLWRRYSRLNECEVLRSLIRQLCSCSEGLYGESYTAAAAVQGPLTILYDCWLVDLSPRNFIHLFNLWFKSV